MKPCLSLLAVDIRPPHLLFASMLLGCASASQASSDPGSSADSGAPGGDVVTDPGTAQTPPMGRANVEAWLATGQYKQWRCEPAVHAARGPSVHTPFDRVCTNDVLSAAAAAGGTDPWPMGAAAVKEIYKSMGDATPTAGYAVSLKTASDSAGGANWYLYETFDGTLYSDGLGTGICTSCHVLAGPATAGITTTGARDYVFTPVP